MSAGTLTLNNNSPVVGGTGTSFATDLVSGDFIVVVVGGVTYTLPVLEVNSNTRLTLVSNYTGPRQVGAAWQAVPRAVQNQITAELVAQTTAALRGLNYDKQNWQAVFSASGDISVMLPDGSTFTGPSWQSIKDTLALIDITAVTALANQVRTDAQQVATDKGTAQSAAQAASTDASKASSAKTAAVAAKTAAVAAKTAAETAKTAAVSAKTDAEAAKTAAEAAASSFHPENLLHKDQNLDDLPDKSAARSHLDVYSKAETDGKGGGYIGQSWWHDNRARLPDGCVAADGQEVDQVGPFADLYADVAAGNRPTTDEATWWADVTKRNCYVLNSSTGKMRLPDRNGVQSGSIKAPVMRGDSGTLVAGSMQKSGVPNITGRATATENNYGFLNSTAITEGAFAVDQSVKYTNLAGSSNTIGRALLFNAKLSSDVFTDGLTEVRMNSLVGCAIIRYAGRAQNAGSLDAMTLSARMESINTDLLAKNVATNARVGYSLISVGTPYPALNSRTVLPNPFGNNVPVWCMCEIFHATLNKWVSTPWTYVTTSLGTLATYSEGEGIVIRTAQSAYVQGSSNSGSNQEFANDYKTPSPMRIHVWKVTA